MLTPEAARWLKLGTNSDENPFVRHENGDITMRADKFEITPRWVNGKYEGWFVRYFWRELLVSVDKMDTKNRDMPCTLANITLTHTISMKNPVDTLTKLKELGRRNAIRNRDRGGNGPPRGRR